MGPSQGETTRGFPGVSAARAEIWKTSSREKCFKAEATAFTKPCTKKKGAKYNEKYALWLTHRASEKA